MDNSLVFVRNKCPRTPNRIAQVQQMKQLESLFADNVFLYIDLNALARPLQVCKNPLSPISRRDTMRPATRTSLLVACNSTPGGLTVLVYQCGGCIRPAKFPGIRIVPQCLDLFEFLFGAVQTGRAAQIATGKILSKAMESEYSGARVD